MANVNLDYNERDALDDIVQDHINDIHSGDISYGGSEDQKYMIELFTSIRAKLATLASVND